MRAGDQLGRQAATDLESEQLYRVCDDDNDTTVYASETEEEMMVTLSLNHGLVVLLRLLSACRLAGVSRGYSLASLTTG